MDLQSIRTRLIQTVNTAGSGPGDVQPDWEESPSRAVAPPQSGVTYATALQALQVRPGAVLPPAAAGAAAPAGGYLRVTALVDRINQLSLQQEAAIAELQSLHGRLPQGGQPDQSPAGPMLDLARSALATAEVDPWGNIRLAYRSPTSPSSPGWREREGGATPRRRTRPQRPSSNNTPRGNVWSAVVAEIGKLVQEPAQLIVRCGLTVWDLGLRLVQPGAIAASPTAQSSGALSVVDAVLWLGSGVIGRVALNLVLAAFPALWSVAVAAITAMTAYALYRATLAPKLAFGPAIRVFLLVVGLVIGGQM